MAKKRKIEHVHLYQKGVDNSKKSFAKEHAERLLTFQLERGIKEGWEIHPDEKLDFKDGAIIAGSDNSNS